MKTLIIFSIILGVFAIYFVLNTEKSISVRGGENAIPAGIDIAKLILNKVKTIEPSKIIGNIIGGSKDLSESNLTEEIKSKIGEIKNKIFNEGIDLIKQPIKNKASEVFCPQN